MTLAMSVQALLSLKVPRTTNEAQYVAAIGEQALSFLAYNPKRGIKSTLQ
jgi:hypothetical protein